MPSGLFFFATGNDLRAVLSGIDNGFPLEFIEPGYYDLPSAIKRYTIANIQDLGISKYGDHAHRPITVLSAGDPIHIHASTQRTGKKYSVNNGDNPNSITMWPGGFYGTDFIIEGRVDTLHNTAEARKLMNLFRKYLQEAFLKKVGYHYIGPDALSCVGKVRFITISVQSLPEYDLEIGT